MSNAKTLRRSYTYAAGMFSISCQATALVLFVKGFNAFGLPARWEIQGLILIGLGVSATIAGYADRDIRVRVGLLVLKGTVLLLIIKPVTYTVGFPLIYFISIATDITYFLPFPANMVTGLLLIAFIILKPDKAPVWYIPKEPVPPGKLIEPAVLSVIFLLLAVCLDFLLRRVVELGADLQRSEEINQKLTETNILFQEYAFEIDRKSSASERNRITREIHDSIGYSLTNIIMTMEAAGDQLNAGKYKSLAELLSRSKTVAKQCLDEIRSILRILRATRDELPTGIRAIHKLVKNFENVAGITVEIEYGNIPWSFGATVDTCLFHIIQESMTNAIRHGNASRIIIVFWTNDSAVQLSVRDNGSGCQHVREGIGLASMRERVSALSGKLSPANTNDGFMVQAMLPLCRKRAFPRQEAANSNTGVEKRDWG